MDLNSQHIQRPGRNARGERCGGKRDVHVHRSAIAVLLCSAPLRSAPLREAHAAPRRATPLRLGTGDMLPLLSPPRPRAARPRASATVSATARPAVILPVAPSSLPPLARLARVSACAVCVTRGACRRSAAGAREQHGRLRAARRGAAGRPRPPRGRRGAGHPPRLAPQRRGPRRRQLLAGHPPPAPRARLVSF